MQLRINWNYDNKSITVHEMTKQNQVRMAQLYRSSNNKQTFFGFSRWIEGWHSNFESYFDDGEFIFTLKLTPRHSKLSDAGVCKCNMILFSAEKKRLEIADRDMAGFEPQTYKIIAL